jgi:hypothetical protein
MSLEYPLDRRSTLLFGWFKEYLQLPNLGTRKAAINIRWSDAFKKVTSGVDFLQFLFSARISWKN